MSVTATVRFGMSTTEILDINVDGSTSPSIIHDAFDKSFALDAAGTGSTGPITDVYADTIALIAGAHTLDLTAIPQSGGGTLDATGLKVQAIRFENLSTNTNLMTIDDGASNGYNILGAALGHVTIHPGAIFQMYFHDKLDNIAAADAEIDFGGTGTESFNLTILVG